MKTEEIEYESGDCTYFVTMTEANGRITMIRMAAIRKALMEGEAAGDDPDKAALADRHLAFAAIQPLVVSIFKKFPDGKVVEAIPIPLSFDGFLDLPQQLTDVAMTAANKRLNPHWFEAEAPSKEDEKKAV